MTRTSDNADRLFARAEAALAEASRLVDESRVWQQKTQANMRTMQLRATFCPRSLRLCSLLDLLARRPADLPFLEGSDRIQ
jgi:hypothetical protein